MSLDPTDWQCRKQTEASPAREESSADPLDKELDEDFAIIALALEVYTAMNREDDEAAMAILKEALANERKKATARALAWYDSLHQYFSPDQHGEAREALRRAVEGS